MQDPCRDAGPVRFEEKAAKIECESLLVIPSNNFLGLATSKNSGKNAKGVRDEGSEHSLNLNIESY